MSSAMPWDRIQGTAFNPDSIMLYFFPGDWVESGIGTHANDVLSTVDKACSASAPHHRHQGTD